MSSNSNSGQTQWLVACNLSVSTFMPRVNDPKRDPSTAENNGGNKSFKNMMLVLPSISCCYCYRCRRHFLSFSDIYTKCLVQIKVRLQIENNFIYSIQSALSSASLSSSSSADYQTIFLQICKSSFFHNR